MILLNTTETGRLPRVIATLGGWEGLGDVGMGRRGQRFFAHFALSAVAAVVTPAMAAGLVAGASAGTQAISSAIYPSGDSPGAGINADTSPYVATHEPAKLSVLVGNDKDAWTSAHSVHVDFRRAKPH